MICEPGLGVCASRSRDKTPRGKALRSAGNSTRLAAVLWFRGQGPSTPTPRWKALPSQERESPRVTCILRTRPGPGLLGSSRPPEVMGGLRETGKPRLDGGRHVTVVGWFQEGTLARWVGGLESENLSGKKPAALSLRTFPRPGRWIVH